MLNIALSPLVPSGANHKWIYDLAKRALRDAISRAGELLRVNCPTSSPITPVARVDAMEQRLGAMLRAVNTVQPALLKFYGSLTDEQKERFNRLTPAQS